MTTINCNATRSLRWKQMDETKIAQHGTTFFFIRRIHPKQNSQIRPSQQWDVLCSLCRFAGGTGSTSTTRMWKRLIADIRVDTDSCTCSRTRWIYERVSGLPTLGTINMTSLSCSYGETTLNKIVRLGESTKGRSMLTALLRKQCRSDDTHDKTRHRRHPRFLHSF